MRKASVGMIDEPGRASSRKLVDGNLAFALPLRLRGTCITVQSINSTEVPRFPHDQSTICPAIAPQLASVTRSFVAGVADDQHRNGRAVDHLMCHAAQEHRLRI